MVKIKMKPINVSNTTLSLNGRKRHRKFDAKQSKKHNYGTALCAVCDKVFTKYHQRTKSCSEECKREKKNAQRREWHKENLEKMKAYSRKYREENREKYKGYQRKYREETRGKSQRKYYEENREKINAKRREYREENREKENAQRRARYHANKEK